MKKRILMVLLTAVLVAVFGMTVIGCKEEEEEDENGLFLIGNRCDVYSITNIKIRGGDTDINETVNLTQGLSKSWYLKKNVRYEYSVEVEYTGDEDPPPTIKDKEKKLSQSVTLTDFEYREGLDYHKENTSEGEVVIFDWSYWSY